jgi:hypothetical protein
VKLLATNFKLEKSVPGYSLTGLPLAPHTVAGGPTVCKYSTAECRSVCLGTETGLNVLPTALAAKIARTKLWQDSPQLFKAQLMTEVSRAYRKAHREGLKLGVRLNVYSDIRWELEFPELFAAFPQVQFYDYTKWPGRLQRPRNYHLTYSYTGTTASRNTALEYARHGINSAVVFTTAALPSRFRFDEEHQALRVIDGDINDFRPGDPTPCVVGLKFKGPRAGLTTIKKFVQAAVP